MQYKLSTSSDMSPISSVAYPWLTNSFFEHILKSSDELPNVRIIDFELHDAVKKGENYGSQIIRAAVNYCVCDESGVQQKSFVIKTTMVGVLQQLIDSAGTFERELKFYRDILPNVMKLSHSIDETSKFAPRCYDVNEKLFYFVLEDLKPDGYRTIDRRVGFDFRATEMVLKKVARYHAMGAMLYTKNSTDMFDAHKKKLINPEDTQIIDIFMCGMKDCQELSRNWPGYEHLSSKLEKLNNIFIDKAQTVFETDESEFNVVTHGDLWVNNIMFKFDGDNQPIDLILVDFQVGFIGSPAIDLAYLLYTSTANDIGEKEWDRLLQIYHIELVKSLNAINYPKPIPTLTEIQIQMLKKPYYTVMVSLLNIVVRHMEKTEHADLELLLFSNETAKPIRHEIYEMPNVRERVLYLLDFFERKGFLEID